MAKRQTLIYIILTILIVTIGVIIWVVSGNLFSSATITPKESALNQTKQLLEIIQDRPSEAIPDDLPGHLRATDCWDLLQFELAQNSNEYLLEVTDEYDSKDDPTSVHDMIEVWIDAIFPDGNRIEVYYSQGGLTGCRSIE